MRNAISFLFAAGFLLLPRLGVAGNVPDKRAIYVYSGFAFDFNGDGDMGRGVLWDLIHYYHNYPMLQRVETSAPTIKPAVVSLQEFRQQFLSGNWGIFMIEGHGDSTSICMEVYAPTPDGAQKRDEAYNRYLSNGFTAAEIVPFDFADDSGTLKYYTIDVTDAFFRTHSGSLADRSVAWLSACDSNGMSDEFLVGGRVHNFVGSGSSEIDWTVYRDEAGMIWGRLGGNLAIGDIKRNFNFNEAFQTPPSWQVFNHTPLNPQAAQEVVYNSPKILELKVTQAERVVYDYKYTDLVFPFLDNPYPGDLSAARIGAAGPGEIKMRIRFSETMDWDLAQTFVIDPLPAD